MESDVWHDERRTPGARREEGGKSTDTVVFSKVVVDRYRSVGMMASRVVVVVMVMLGLSFAQDTSLTQNGQCVVHQLSYEVVQQLLTGSKQCTFSSDNLLLALVQLQQEVRKLKTGNILSKGDLRTQQQPNLPGSDNCDTPDNKPRDCHDLLQAGNNQNGVYQIFPYGCRKREVGVRVWCELEGGDSGWTVVLSRRPLLPAQPQVDFDLIWRQYRQGFGDPNTEQWIGNEVLHEMTTGQPQVLRVDLTDWDGAKRYAEYHSFMVEDEDSGYRLHLDQYSGDAGDALVAQDNMRFSTKDRDHDKSETNCAATHFGGFWYNDCTKATPTSILKERQKSPSGITWETWKPDFTTLKELTFKIRPKPCRY